MLIWPKEFHWDKKSYLSTLDRIANLKRISTSKSIPELENFTKSQAKEWTEKMKNSKIYSPIQEKSNPKTNKSPNLMDSSPRKSFDDFDFEESSTNKKMRTESDLDYLDTPVYLVSVNNKNQLFYTVLLESSLDIDSELVFKTDMVHPFEENISTMTHIGSGDIILICGYPHIFFWNVPEKCLVHSYLFPISREPWFIIWDALYISSKKTLVFGLNNGFVVQLHLNSLNERLGNPKIFQSNDEGNGVYSLAYIPSLDKILATNNNDILTEFVFQTPKKEKGKFVGSTKNISFFRNQKSLNYKSKSIRNISGYGKKKDIIKPKSNSKNWY